MRRSRAFRSDDLHWPHRDVVGPVQVITPKSERKREEKRHIPTKDLHLVPEVDESAHRGQPDLAKDLPGRARRPPPDDRLGAFLALERPRGHLPWERNNHGPRRDRGWDLSLLVAGAGFEPATYGNRWAWAWASTEPGRPQRPPNRGQAQAHGAGEGQPPPSIRSRAKPTMSSAFVPTELMVNQASSHALLQPPREPRNAHHRVVPPERRGSHSLPHSDHSAQVPTGDTSR